MEAQPGTSRIFSGALASICAVMLVGLVAISGNSLESYTSTGTHPVTAVGAGANAESDADADADPDSNGPGSGSLNQSQSKPEPAQTDEARTLEGATQSSEVREPPSQLAMSDGLTGDVASKVDNGTSSNKTAPAGRDTGRSQAVRQPRPPSNVLFGSTGASSSKSSVANRSTHQDGEAPKVRHVSAAPPTPTPARKTASTTVGRSAATPKPTTPPASSAPQTDKPEPTAKPGPTSPPTTKPPTSKPATSTPTPAGKTLFVDGVSGKFSNPGTEAAPFGRPIDALVKAEPGTTIYIRGGTYSDQTHGTNIITRSGTPNDWIRIAPYPGERVELIAGGQWGNGFEFKGASYVEISGFVIRGRADSVHGSGIAGNDQSHDIRVAGNYIEGFGGAGISFVKSSRIRIEGNEVRNNAMRSHYQGSGISFYRSEGAAGSGISNVVRNNYIVGNRNEVRGKDGRITDGNCIILDELDLVGYQGSTLIENNVCLENGGRGVVLFKSSNVTARNNTLVGNGWSPEVTSGRAEMAAGHGKNIVFSNNLVLNRGQTASFVSTNAEATFTNNYVLSGPPPDPGNHLLDPNKEYFSGASANGPVGNFRPTASSGLANTGRADLQSGHDLSGRARPAPGTVGAFEQ